jgi:hypothetical protein
MLEIGIHHGYDVALSEAKPLLDGATEPTRPSVPLAVQQPDPDFTRSSHSANDFGRVVVGVVHEDELPPADERLKSYLNPCHQDGDVGGFVARGHHDRQSA